MLWEAAVAKFGAPFCHLPDIVPPVYYGFNLVYLKIQAGTLRWDACDWMSSRHTCRTFRQIRRLTSTTTLRTSY